MSPSVSETNSSGAGGMAASDWDHLWLNASRIPITSIPEPTTASLVLGGALLLWSRKLRKRTEQPRAL